MLVAVCKKSEVYQRKSPDYESGGQRFESVRARQQHVDFTTVFCSRLFLREPQFAVGLQILFAESSQSLRLPVQRAPSSERDSVPEFDAQSLVSGP